MSGFDIEIVKTSKNKKQNTVGRISRHVLTVCFKLLSVFSLVIKL